MSIVKRMLMLQTLGSQVRIPPKRRTYISVLLRCVFLCRQGLAMGRSYLQLAITNVQLIVNRNGPEDAGYGNCGNYCDIFDHIRQNAQYNISIINQLSFENLKTNVLKLQFHRDVI
jgi:hypothetical protein